MDLLSLRAIDQAVNIIYKLRPVGFKEKCITEGDRYIRE
jgi:hypothetical protein